MENTNKCPGCSRHCDLNNLQCGKGEAILRGEDVSSHGHEHGERKHCEGRHHDGKHCEGKHHCGKHHGHHRPEFPEGSLADLLAKCGHRLFHGGDESLFHTLSEQEQKDLKVLLKKLLAE